MDDVAVEDVLAVLERVAAALERMTTALEAQVAAQEANAAFARLLTRESSAVAPVDSGFVDSGFEDYRLAEDGVWRVNADGAWREATPAEQQQIEQMNQRRQQRR